MSKAITRFAPSPTGFLHVGHLRNAMLSYAIAKKYGGDFILRIEDTDQRRYVERSVEYIIDTLQRFGLDFNRGPSAGQIERLGTFSWYTNDWLDHLDEVEKVNDKDFADIYIQSQRLAIFQKYAWELVRKGFAYFCFCTEERLNKLKEEQKSIKTASTGYDGFCKRYSLEEALKKIKRGERPTIRLNVDSYKKYKSTKYIKVIDKVMGKLEFNLDFVTDQILIKSNGFPTYHLAVVVDDYLMGVTHMMRGVEWISSTPKQIMIYDMLGWRMPEIYQVPVLLDPAGGKLSKRKGSVFVGQFLEEGYLEEALLNFLMLLGWSPTDNREMFTMEEFIKALDITKLNKSNPIFNRQKLNWFNGEYIRKLTVQQFADKVKHWFKEFSQDEEMKNYVALDTAFDRKAALIQERISTIKDAESMLQFFYKRLPVPDYSAVKGVKEYGIEILRSAREEYIKMLNSYNTDSDLWNKERWIEELKSLAVKHSLKPADMFMIVRLHICGSEFSPPLFEAMQILGKNECLERLSYTQ